MRRAHTLSKPQRRTSPQYCIFVDTETTQHPQPDGRIEQRLRLGVAIFRRYRKDGKADQREVCRFHTGAEFWDFVESKVHKGTVMHLFAHNAVFDFVVLRHMTELSARGYACQFVFDNQSTFIAKWRKEEHTILILNTANWFKGSVEDWGAALELPKLKMPSPDASEEDWFVYCEQDAEILVQLHEWYVRFLEEHNLGPWKFTAASNAFSAYRYRFMDHPITIPDDAEESRLARQSYHGGRTEVFRVGRYTDGPYYKVDVNSMYPAAMWSFEYPTALDRTGDTLTLEQAEFMLDGHCIVADCSLVVGIPFFHYQLGDRSVYPIGSFRTTLTTEEFRLALANRWITEIHGYARYRARRIFDSYVEEFYALKSRAAKEGSMVIKNFTKLFLNSLYGKFGQRGFEDKVIGRADDCMLRVSYGYDAVTKEKYLLRQVGFDVMYSSKAGESYNSFCAIASHVTANARLYLYNLVLQAGRENCFYCDTDSLILNSVGYERLKDRMDDFSLGCLTLEGISDKMDIVAPKHYRFADSWTIKGVRHTARQVGSRTYEQEQWPGLNTVLENGEEIYYNTVVEKRLVPQIRSGWVDVLGHVRPFTLLDGLVRAPEVEPAPMEDSYEHIPF